MSYDNFIIIKPLFYQGQYQIFISLHCASVFVFCLKKKEWHWLPVSTHWSVGRRPPLCLDTTAHRIPPLHRDGRQGDILPLHPCWDSWELQQSRCLSLGHTCSRSAHSVSRDILFAWHLKYREAHVYRTMTGWLQDSCDTRISVNTEVLTEMYRYL